jgi:hypothetical protein
MKKLVLSDHKESKVPKEKKIVNKIAKITKLNAA